MTVKEFIDILNRAYYTKILEEHNFITINGLKVAEVKVFQDTEHLDNLGIEFQVDEDSYRL